MEIMWSLVLFFVIMSVTGFYGLYLALFWANGKTLLLALVYGYTITFETVYPVKVILVLLHTATGQYSLSNWIRTHRQHHKFTDTDADPHNSKRGFLFSHVIWLLVRKHPKVITVGKTLDVADLEADPLFKWQRKYYLPLYFVISLAIPVAVPMYYWNESLYNSYFISYALRNILLLHMPFLINSAGHMYGMRLYNKDILPVDVVPWIGSFLAGEQYHNYHHAFPYDYRTSELGLKLNISAVVIDILAFLGLAWNLRTASDELIRQQILKSGDGSYNYNSYMLKKIAQN